MKLIKPGILVISMMCAASAHADTIVRKGGEWRRVISGISPEPKTDEKCFSAATAEQIMEKAAAGKVCSKRELTFNGNVATIDLECSDFEMKGSSVVSGNTASKADLMVKAGTGSAAKTFHMTVDSKWIGECKPGETPE